MSLFCVGFFFFCFSWISCIPTGTVQAQEKTGMKPPPTISLTPASNLWVIQMWVEALDESFLRGCTGKLCTTINVASPGTQMVELKGKPSKYNKTLLLHVTWCTLHSYTKCHVMKCRFFFGYRSFHVDTVGVWSAEPDTEHDSGYPLIISCGRPMLLYNLKGYAFPCQSHHLACPQGNWCTSQSDTPVILWKHIFRQQHVQEKMPISNVSVCAVVCELEEQRSTKCGRLKQNVALMWVQIYNYCGSSGRD